MGIAAGFYIGAFVIGAVLFYIYAKIGKLVRCIFFTAVTGAAALGLLWLTGKVFVIKLTLTPLSLLISVLLGIPGVLFMLVTHLL